MSQTAATLILVSFKFNLMKYVLTSLAVLSIASAAFANTPPNPQVLSAAMRDGTTIMDITFRVDDLDDATVKVRALAFVDGVRSFANVLRPSSFVEGTGANLGDTIQSNTDHTLAWDVGADWDIDLGQVKFEILAMDGRGLLAFDWITIPAAGGEPELTISKDSPTNSAVLDALFWQYADGDAGLLLENGVLRGTAASGIFAGIDLVSGVATQVYATPFVLKQMDLDPAFSGEVAYAAVTARAGLSGIAGWHAANRPFAGVDIIVGWGRNTSGQATIPAGLSGVTAIAAGRNFSLALKDDGTVVGWGANGQGQTSIPAGLSGVTAIAAGNNFSLALKDDGTVVGWGSNNYGESTPPAGLSGVTAIAAGDYHSLALKNDGTVVVWGENGPWGTNTLPPAGLSGVTALAAGIHSLALKDDGTVVGWGPNDNYGARTPPAGLTGVTAIAAAYWHSLALKDDGTVVGWGSNNYGESTPPAGLTGVTAISAGQNSSLALKDDGTVVGWGDNSYGQISIPAGLSGVTAIAAGSYHSLALKVAAP